MHVDELRDAGRYLRSNAPVPPPSIDALRQRVDDQRRRTRRRVAGLGAVAVLGAVMIVPRLASAPDTNVAAGPSVSTPSVTSPDLLPGDGPSQSPADAARDGVHPLVAGLSPRARAKVLVSVAVGDHTWAITEADGDLAPPEDGGVLGDASGTYGRDWVQLNEYGELLLLDSQGAIERAYPMAGLIPTWLHVTDDAVYAGHTGDGGLPASSLIRVDRKTLASTVVVFPYDTHRPEGPGWITAPATTPISDFVQVGPDGTGTVVDSWIGPVTADIAAIDSLLDGLREGATASDQGGPSGDGIWWRPDGSTGELLLASDMPAGDGWQLTEEDGQLCAEVLDADGSSKVCTGVPDAAQSEGFVEVAHDRGGAEALVFGVAPEATDRVEVATGGGPRVANHQQPVFAFWIEETEATEVTFVRGRSEVLATQPVPD